MKHALLLLCILVPWVGSAQPHVRMVQKPLSGTVHLATTPGGRPVSMRLPAAVSPSREMDVLVHAHGAAWLVHQAVEETFPEMASVALQWGSGSMAYHAAVEGEDRVRMALPDLLETLLRSVSGDSLRVRHVYLSAFSAGHGAVRVWLRDAPWGERVRGVLLLDGLHTGLLPDAPSRTPDPSRLAWFLPLAREAVAGTRTFILTHSEILPETFASTTECTNWLLAALDVPRTPHTSGGMEGMRLTSRTQRSRFWVDGYAGDTADDHIDHLHALPHYLRNLISASR